MRHNKTIHQQHQIEVINEIEKQNESGNLKFSTIEPVKNFAADPRICLTSFHFPLPELLDKVEAIVNKLRNISKSLLLSTHIVAFNYQKHQNHQQSANFHRRRYRQSP